MNERNLRVRRDLEASLQGEGSEAHYVIKDPRSRRYFRLRPPEWWLVQQFDGERTTAEVGEKFSAQFQAELQPAQLAAYLGKLETLGLFEGERSEKESFALSHRKSDFGLGRLFFIKLSAVDPDVWLGRWAARLSFLFRPWFWPASLLLIGSALWVVGHNASEFTFTLQSLLSVQSVWMLLVSLFVVIALHEIAHGLTCRHLGGHVHEMGFLLLYFQPCLYCDLSDAWMFRERWKKLLVTFSGAYFQILLGALGVWGWRITVPGTWVNDLFWFLAVASLFNVLFNFNPLIKLDGYYLLSDGLGIPNLRARSFSWMAHRLLGRLWEYGTPSSRERRLYWLYGPAAVAYSSLLIGYLVWITLGFVVDQWRGPGFVLYLLGGAVMFRRPLGRISRRAVPLAPNVRKTVVWILFALALVLAFAIPFPYSVSAPARVEPWGQYVVHLLADGYVKTEWYEHGRAELTHTRLSKLVASGFTTLNLQPSVAVGDTVTAGDTVLKIGADQFSSLHEEAKQALAAKQAELDLLLFGARKQELARARADVDQVEEIVKGAERELLRADSLRSKNLLPQSEWERLQTEVQSQRARLESARQTLELLKAPPQPERVNKLKAEIAQLSSQEQFYAGQLASTVLQSPVSGVVLRLASREGEICRIARLDSIRSVMDVDESDLALLQINQKVALKVRSQPFARFEGSLFHVSPMGDSASSTSTFNAVAGFENPTGIAPGASGYAKVDAGRKTLAWRLSRAVIRFIRIEFWSWW